MRESYAIRKSRHYVHQGTRDIFDIKFENSSCLSVEEYVKLMQLLDAEITMFIDREKKLKVADDHDRISAISKLNMRTIARSHKNQDTIITNILDDSEVSLFETRMYALLTVIEFRFPDKFISCLQGKIYRSIYTYVERGTDHDDWAELITLRPYMWLLIIIQDIVNREVNYAVR